MKNPVQKPGVLLFSTQLALMVVSTSLSVSVSNLEEGNGHDHPANEHNSSAVIYIAPNRT